MKKFDPRWLPYFGATVQAVLFAKAGDAYFGSWGWLIGLGVGMVVNISLAFASSRYSSIAENRKPLVRLTLAGMFLLSPITVTLSLYAPSSVYTSISWAFATDLAVVLAGAIAGKSLMFEEQKPKSAEQTAQRNKRKKSETLCHYAGAGCGRKFATQNAANAHARTCEFKPTISMPVDWSSGVSRPNVDT